MHNLILEENYQLNFSYLFSVLWFSLGYSSVWYFMQ